jgi:predicted ATP-grasp superfamily ATP-dependent carboligase
MSIRPRVLIANVSSQIGLTMIRELARHGVEVHGLTDDPHGIGCYSRYLAGSVMRERGEALVGQVRAMATRLTPCVVMAISEPDICLLNAHRRELADVPLLIPDEARMAIVLDKVRTRVVAQDVGIRVPRVWDVSSLAELARVDVAFPVVLKWARPLAMLPKLRQAGLPLDKFKYCYDRAELEAYLRPFETVGELPVIAEYCPGHGLGLSFFMRHGEALLSFQHRRLHEWPPEGGFSTLCEGVPLTNHTELREQSIDLLRRIGWEGPAMVEYRHDPITGQSWLMEINGRLWGSLPLASHSGAEFAWMMYAVLGLKDESVRCRVRTDLRCRSLVTEARWLLRVVFAPRRIQDRSLRFSRLREIVAWIGMFFDPRIRYFVFSPDDPVPALADLLAGAWRRVLRRGEA